MGWGELVTQRAGAALFQVACSCHPRCCPPWHGRQTRPMVAGSLQGQMGHRQALGRVMPSPANARHRGPLRGDGECPDGGIGERGTVARNARPFGSPRSARPGPFLLP